jgi:hypothetical protein
MEKLIQLFEEYVLKAITMTEAAIAQDLQQNADMESFTDNRERLFMIIDQISQQIEWQQVANERREEINRQIDYIKKLDEKLLVKLQEFRQEIKRDIESTHKQKENIRAYNINDVSK